MKESHYEGRSHAQVAGAFRFAASADELELLVDNFAGGGGASEGIERAFGRPVDIAINHSPEALAMHAANHPETTHYCESVFDIDPVEVTKGRPVALVWLSPDCKHFSKAKGGTPVSNNIRGLAWVAVRWAKVKPRVIGLENVEEFLTWGPIVNGKPCPRRKGETFKEFVATLESHGYKVEYKLLRGSDYGAPTIRKRLFLIARRDNLPIVWPEPTHGDPRSDGVQSGRLKPWRTAGTDCIDWSIPCPSIFERKRPLQPATLRRIAKGIMKFVINSADPFIVTYYGDKAGEFRGSPIDDPLRTQSTENRFALVMPTLMHVTHQGSERNAEVSAPLATITGANRGEQALVTAHITKMRTGSIGSDLGEPLHTVTAGGDQARPGTGNAMGIVAATLVKQNFGAAPHQAVNAPLHTITTQGNKFGVVAATLIQTGYGEREGQEPRVPGLGKPLGTAVAGGVKHAVVSAFLAKHYGGVVGTGVDVPTGTVTTSDHHSVVTSHLVKLRNNQFGQDVREPMPTLTAGGGHLGEVRALLTKYHGVEWAASGGADDGLATVVIRGELYVIVDIGLRMLTPRELARAQGFRDSYVLDPIIERNRSTGEIRGTWSGGKPVSESRSNPKMIRKKGKKGPSKWVKAPLSKSAQVRMIGNSVCPDVAEALLRANFSRELDIARAA